MALRTAHYDVPVEGCGFCCFGAAFHGLCTADESVKRGLAGKKGTYGDVFAFMALFSLTDLVYAVDGDTSAAAVLSAGITENESGIEYAGNEKLRNYLGSYSSIINKGIFKYVFQYIGIMNLAVLCSILAKNNFKRADGWKRSFFAVPLLAYNFGTMLLLTGADFRFFYVSFLVCPVIIFAMFHVDFQVKGSQLLLKKE